MSRYIRQAGILSPPRAEATTITVCGCGTVGSNAAEQLCKAGFADFTICDMDIVEDHNLPSQAFTPQDVGVSKVEALGARLLQLGAKRVRQLPRPLKGSESFSSNVVILAVDDMDLRKSLFNAQTSCELVLDFRMGGWLLQAWALDPLDFDQAEAYRDTLFPESEAVEAACGTRTFAPVGALSGALATMLVTKHLSDDAEVPFYTFCDMDMMQVVTTGAGKAVTA